MHAMAIEESDREDLLGQAVQMPHRILIQVDSVNSLLNMSTRSQTANDSTTSANVCCEVFIGQRKSGDISIYFDADPVFQFNQSNELRRAFLKGRKYAARDGQLSSVENENRGGKVGLVWKNLDAEELVEFEALWRRLLQHFVNAIDSDAFKIVGQVPENEGLPNWLITWVSSGSHPLKIAARPNAD
jgi:hypothetical protein